MVRFDLRKVFRVPNAEQRIAGLNLRPDLARAALKMLRDEQSDQEIVELENHLTETESVMIVVEGSVDRQLGFLALTTERVLFRMHRARPGLAVVIALGDVSQVEDRARGMNGRVSIQTAGSVLQVDKILGIQGAEFAKALRDQLDQPGGAAEHDPLQELIDLRARRDAGTIGEAEYQDTKSRLLDEL